MSLFMSYVDMFDLFFQPETYIFNRNIKDMNPYKIVRNDNKTTLIFNALGLSSEDIKISLSKTSYGDILNISGSKKIDILNKTFDISSNFKVNIDGIKNIEYKCENGLLYIEIFYKEKPEVTVEITKK